MEHLEHVSTVVERSLGDLAGRNGNGSAAHIWDDLTASGKPRTLPELRRVFDVEESLENLDEVVDLHDLRAAENGTLEVPGLGAFAWNEWSRRQAASLLGVRWDRWFENATPAERADELNRRFARSRSQVKLRTRSFAADEPRPDGASGIVRAFVSPAYTPISDSRLATLLMEQLGPGESAFRLIRQAMTDRTTSYVVAVGEPYRVGGPGEIGDVWGGILVRNSGVGFASLLASLHLTRLVCKNGMTAPVPGARLIRRVHRLLDWNRLRETLAERLRDVAGRLRQGGEVLRGARDRVVENVEAEVRRVLERARLPLRLVKPILDAFGQEPERSAFGIAQAMTRAAQEMAPEARVEIEEAAGNYLRGTEPRGSRNGN